jgi:hypothetical protein
VTIVHGLNINSLGLEGRASHVKISLKIPVLDDRVVITLKMERSKKMQTLARIILLIP